AILGGGSWGTGLAIVLSRSRKAHQISLWMRDAALVEAAASSRVNDVYLPGCEIPTGITVTSELAAALQHAEIVIGAMPAAHAREIYSTALPLIESAGCVLVSATKGLEPSTHLRMSEVIEQVAAEQHRNAPPLAILSGPSFALETARGEPTAVVVAARCSGTTTAKGADEYGVSRTAAHIQSEFVGPSFRLYTNDDVVGVELAGAMKNVIAIAAGACQGLGLGTNALTALITRGLAEMSRLALALGARAETLSGLAGLGDLVLTCTGALSRNRRVGIELGQGRALAEILASTRMVAEGVGTAAALLTLAREYAIELPITEQVNAILHHGKPPREAIATIMERPQKHE
ncbi:MAG TPA: NAD(P)H-dependent glycerol-3-phosphate dehydrogenase, partial [Candidatus Acidoferrum sp.]